MRCTYFPEILRDIRKQELRELYAAVKAHGGKFVFTELRPLVNACDARDLAEHLYEVTELRNEGDDVAIYGFKHEKSHLGALAAVRLYYLPMGERTLITMEIPETEDVKDVRE